MSENLTSECGRMAKLNPTRNNLQSIRLNRQKSGHKRGHCSRLNKNLEFNFHYGSDGFAFIAVVRMNSWSSWRFIQKQEGFGFLREGAFVAFHNAGQGWIPARADFSEILAVCWSW
jgi:hypothetical protein